MNTRLRFRIAGPILPIRKSRPLYLQLVAYALILGLPVYGALASTDTFGYVATATFTILIVAMFWRGRRQEVVLSDVELRVGPYWLPLTSIVRVRRVGAPELETLLDHLRSQPTARDVSDPRRLERDAVVVEVSDGPLVLLTPPDPEAFVDAVRVAVQGAEAEAVVPARGSGIAHVTPVWNRRLMREYRWRARQARSRWYRFGFTLAVFNSPSALDGLRAPVSRPNGIALGPSSRLAPCGLLVDFVRPREDEQGRYDAMLFGCRSHDELRYYLRCLEEDGVEGLGLPGASEGAGDGPDRRSGGPSAVMVPRAVRWIGLGAALLVSAVAVIASGVQIAQGGDLGVVALLLFVAAFLSWPAWRPLFGGPKPLNGDLPVGYALRAGAWAVGLVLGVGVVLALLVSTIEADEAADYPGTATAVVESSGRCGRAFCSTLVADIDGATVRSRVSDRYEVGARVPVRYKPDDPDRLVVEGTSGDFGRGFVTAVVVIVAGLLWFTRPRRRPSSLSEPETARAG